MESQRCGTIHYTVRGSGDTPVHSERDTVISDQSDEPLLRVGGAPHAARSILERALWHAGGASATHSILRACLSSRCCIPCPSEG
eukprot:scaffold325919_cov52-Tisochrysis_lutea.AAC.1